MNENFIAIKKCFYLILFVLFCLFVFMFLIVMNNENKMYELEDRIEKLEE